MTATLGRPPSVEQLDQIRRVSTVIYGNPGKAFLEYGRPETREEASELIRKLDQVRGTTVYGTDVSPRRKEDTMETSEKTCIKCGDTKSRDRFGKDKRTADGLGKTCLDCRRPKTGPRAKKPPNRSQTSVEGATPPTPHPPEEPLVAPSTAAPNGDWRDRFRDPRLSDLEKLQSVVNEITPGVEFTLEDTAALSQGISEFL